MKQVASPASVGTFTGRQVHAPRRLPVPDGGEQEFDRLAHLWPQFRKSPKSLKHISPYTGALTPYDGEYAWLAPGQGVLLKPEW